MLLLQLLLLLVFLLLGCCCYSYCGYYQQYSATAATAVRAIDLYVRPFPHHAPPYVLHHP